MAIRLLLRVDSVWFNKRFHIDEDLLVGFVGPYTFHLTTDGGVSGSNDNTATFSVICNSSTLVSGFLPPGQTNNYSVSPCSPISFI